jgi:hypothetical protein
MTNQHPISPPNELVAEWRATGAALGQDSYNNHLATLAAQWGWDQRGPQIQEAADAELEAVLNLLKEIRPNAGPHVYLDPQTRYEITVIDKLIQAVRLQRRSRKHMALLALRKRIKPGSSEARIIREALELLPDNPTPSNP